MKRLLIILFLIACISDSNAQDLTLVLYNKTGKQLDSLLFDDAFLGSLEDNDSIYITYLSDLTLSGPYLLNQVKAVLENNEPVKTLAGCGTKASKVEFGVYKYEIVLFENDSYKRLALLKL